MERQSVLSVIQAIQKTKSGSEPPEALNAHEDDDEQMEEAATEGEGEGDGPLDENGNRMLSPPTEAPRDVALEQRPGSWCCVPMTFFSRRASAP